MTNKALYIIAFVLLLGVGWRLYSQYAIAHKVATETTPRNSSTNTVGADSKAGPEGRQQKGKRIRARELNKTKACEKRSVEENFDLLPSQFLRLVRERNISIVLPFTARCFVSQQVYNLRVNRVDKTSGKIYFQEPQGQVALTKIERVPESLLSDEIHERLSEKKKRRKRRANVEDRKYNKNSAIRFTLEWKSNIARTSFGAPPSHPLASLVNSEQVRDLIAKGTPLFDLRPPGWVKKSALPNAKGLLSDDNDALIREIFSPTKLKQRGTHFRLPLLPKDHETPLIVYSSGPGEFASYNAVSILAIEGYKNIYWFRGGFEEWNNVLSETPVNVESIRTVNTEEANQLLLNGALPVDVRGQKAFNDRHLPSALNRPFHQRTTDNGLPVLRKANLQHADIVQAGDIFQKDDFDMGKGQALVVYGSNEYDWRALKAAVLLRARGFENVYWLRTGIRSWTHASITDPKRYRHYRGDEKGQLTPSQKRRKNKPEQKRPNPSSFFS